VGKGWEMEGELREDGQEKWWKNSVNDSE